MARDNKRNYYRILHVQPDAPVEIIRTSYRTLMQSLKAHPDLGGDHWNAALINEAYAVLMDPQKRAEYDRRTFHVKDWRVIRKTGSPEVEVGPAHQPAGGSHTAGVHFCTFCKTPHEQGDSIRADSLCLKCGSPLAPARNRQLEASWRRAINRVPKNQEIAFYTSWPPAGRFAGKTREMSLSGMKFATAHAVPQGHFQKIDCSVCKAVARVVYCRPAGNRREPEWTVGVEFFTLRFEKSRGAFISTRA